MNAVSLDREASRTRERRLQRVLTVWILSGLLFMLLPGTFLGVWNLIAIAGERAGAQIDPAWIQAHGHAQIFGWIGTFILGIGFYSLSKMGGLGGFAIARAWTSWALWTAGVAMRWAANLWLWQWRSMLPVSALLELSAFLLFFGTVRRHSPGAAAQAAAGRPVWMIAVIAGTAGFFVSLVANLALAIHSAVTGAGPAIPHDLDQRLLVLFTWGFPVLTIWGFSARWLPVFLGTAGNRDRALLGALAAAAAGVLAAMAGWCIPASAVLLAAATLSGAALRIFHPSLKPPKIAGVHPTFPFFIRLAYGWLVIAAAISLAAAFWDRAGGIWGASRHALTVGFVAAMVFSIGQRVLPAFCGMRILYSPKLMFWAAALLNLGCLLRVASEIGAYESYVPVMWALLPVSAGIEMTAITLFAVNLLLTFRRPPAHLAGVA
jgi:uncharacterized protein involved in response to NO